MDKTAVRARLEHISEDGNLFSRVCPFSSYPHSNDPVLTSHDRLILFQLVDVGSLVISFLRLDSEDTQAAVPPRSSSVPASSLATANLPDPQIPRNNSFPNAGGWTFENDSKIPLVYKTCAYLPVMRPPPAEEFAPFKLCEAEPFFPKGFELTQSRCTLVAGYLSTLIGDMTACIEQSPNEAAITFKRYLRIVDMLFFLLGDINTLNILNQSVVADLTTVEDHPSDTPTKLNLPRLGIAISKLPIRASRCNTGWEGEHTAYRCLTCAIVASSCICAHCFHSSDHRGHDHMVYRSELGGCCDCGDASAWKETGFCQRHQPTKKVVESLNGILAVNAEYWEHCSNSTQKDSRRRWQTAWREITERLDERHPPSTYEQSEDTFDAYDASLLLNPELRVKLLVVFSITLRRLTGLLINSVTGLDRNQLSTLLARSDVPLIGSGARIDGMSHRFLSTTTFSTSAQSIATIEIDAGLSLEKVIEGTISMILEWSMLHQGIRRVLVVAAEMAPPASDKGKTLLGWQHWLNDLVCFPDLREPKVQQIACRKDLNNLSRRGHDTSTLLRDLMSVFGLNRVVGQPPVPNRADTATPVPPTNRNLPPSEADFEEAISTPPSPMIDRMPSVTGNDELRGSQEMMALGAPLNSSFSPIAPRVLRPSSADPCVPASAHRSRFSFMITAVYLLPKLKREEQRVASAIGRPSIKITGVHAFLTNLLLDLLFDRRFKLRFGREFVLHYWHLIKCSDPAMERLTVQLFSIGGILHDLYVHQDLVKLLLGCGDKLLLQCAATPQVSPANKMGPIRLQLDSPNYNRKRILHLLSDVRTALVDNRHILNLVTTDSTDKFRRDYLVNGWLNILKLCQYCTEHKRRTRDHVEFDDNGGWSQAYVLTTEVLSSLSGFYSYLAADKSHAESLAPQILSAVFESHNGWLLAMNEKELQEIQNGQGSVLGFGGHDTRHSSTLTDLAVFLVEKPLLNHSVSLQIPLTRTFWYALLFYVRLCLSPMQALFYMTGGTCRLTDALRHLDYSVRALCFHYQAVNVHMWARNGMAVHNETTLYRRHHWATYYAEADLKAISLYFIIAGHVRLQMLTEEDAPHEDEDCNVTVAQINNALLSDREDIGDISVKSREEKSKIAAVIANAINRSNSTSRPRYLMNPDHITSPLAFIEAGIALLLSRMDIPPTLIVIPDDQAEVQDSNRDSALASLISLIGHTLSWTTSSLLGESTNGREDSLTPNLEYLLLERLVLQRFLLPCLAAGANVVLPSISEVQEACNSTVSKNAVLEIIRKWNGKQKKREEDDDDASNHPTPQSTGSGALLCPDSKRHLNQEGWIYLDPFYQYIPPEENQLADEGFTQWLKEGTHLKLWFEHQSSYPPFSSEPPLVGTANKNAQSAYDCLTHEEKAFIERISPGFFSYARSSQVRSLIMLTFIRLIIQSFGLSQFIKTVKNKLVHYNDETIQPTTSFSEKLWMHSIFALVRLVAVEKQWQAMNGTVPHQEPKTVKSLKWDAIDVFTFCDAVTKNVGDDASLDTYFNTRFEVDNSASFSFLELVQWFREEVCIEVVPPGIDLLELILSECQHDPNSSVLSQRCGRVAAKEEAKRRASLQIGDEIKRKQEAIMESFKLKQTEFDLNEEFSDSESSEMMVMETTGTHVPRAERVASDDDSMLETDDRPQDVCVVCVSSRNTPDDPIGTLGRYQFSSWHGANPPTKLSRSFELSIHLRDMKKAAVNGNSPASTQASLDVIKSMVDNTNEYLDLFDESISFERSVNEASTGEVGDHSWIDYHLPSLEGMIVAQSSSIVWWSCGHKMHKNCYKNQRNTATRHSVTNIGVINFTTGNRLGQEPIGADMVFTPTFLAFTPPYDGDTPPAPPTPIGDQPETGETENTISPAAFRQRVSEHSLNPYFARTNIQDSLCPYCNRKYNFLLLDENPTETLKGSNRSQDISSIGKDHFSLVKTKGDHGYRYLHDTWRALKNHLVLPPLLHSVTYRQILARLLLGNSLAFQKNPQFVFDHGWSEISELGCTISSRYSLVAPSVPVQCCFTSPTDSESFHLLGAHPLSVISDCVGSMINVEEQTMRREQLSAFSPALFSMLKSFNAKFAKCARRLKSTVLTTPDDSVMPTNILYRYGNFSFAGPVRPFCNDALDDSSIKPPNAFDIFKFNVLSCFFYGRTSYSPADETDEASLPPSRFKETNTAMFKSFANSRTRMLWLTRLLLVAAVDLADAESELEKKEIQHHIWYSCLNVFLMECLDVLTMFAPPPVKEPSMPSSDPFMNILLSAFGQWWTASADERYVREPFNTVNELFRIGSHEVLSDLIKYKEVPRDSIQKLMDKALKHESVFLPVKPPANDIEYLHWEDSPAAMQNIAKLDLRAAGILSSIRRSKSNTVMRSGLTLDDSLTHSQLRQKRLLSCLSSGRQSQSDETLPATGGTLPDMDSHSPPVSPTLNNEATPLPPSEHPQHNSTASGVHMPDRDAGQYRLASLEDLLINVREMVELARYNVSMANRREGITSSRRGRGITIPTTEGHPKHFTEPFFFPGNKSEALKCERKGSFQAVPEDVIFRYAKFLADQNEGDICRMMPKRRRHLYMQKMNPPLTFDDQSKEAPPKETEPLAIILLYATFPFLRQLRLLTQLLWSNSNEAPSIFPSECTFANLLRHKQSGKKAACDLDHEDVLLAFNALIRNTPLEPLKHLYPINKGASEQQPILDEIRRALQESWYARCSRVVQPVREDGTLMKNFATTLQTDLLVESTDAERFIFDIERNCYHASSMLSLSAAYMSDERRRLLWWYLHPMTQPYSKSSWNQYVSSIYDSGPKSDPALNVFAGSLNFPNIDPGYEVKIRLWIPYFVNLPSKFDLLFHSSITKKLPREAALRPGTLDRRLTPSQIKSILHIPKNQMYICLYCGAYICADHCCAYLKSRRGQITTNTSHPLARHAQTCSSRIGVFLHPASTVVFLVVIRPTIAEITAWASCYRDAFGEEDRYLTRGKPLHLSRTKLRRLFKECWSMTTFQLKQHYGWMPLR